VTVNLETRYLGFTLSNPFMPGASPLVDDLDVVKRLEDAGAAAIVMHSLFEEQIEREAVRGFMKSGMHGESAADALSYTPNPDRFALSPEDYLEHITKIKKIVRVPLIASLNGTKLRGWLKYGKAMEQAGADALELNVYTVTSDPEVSSQEVEDRQVEMLRAVKRAVRIPVAVKLSPYYAALPQFVRRLDQAGADGIVLFNRFYQPDIDPENLDVSHHLTLSSSVELPLRLRWLAMLSGRVRASLAVTGGVQGARDAVKALMAGAHAVQMVSALLRSGPEYLRRVLDETKAWLADHEYKSLGELRGKMDFTSCSDPSAYERANYMLLLQSRRPGK
jgi:dihydroorotate dehydrogenase (fumarate)